MWKKGKTHGSTSCLSPIAGFEIEPLPVSEFIITLFETMFLCESFTPLLKPVVPLCVTCQKTKKLIFIFKRRYLRKEAYLYTYYLE